MNVQKKQQVEIPMERCRAYRKDGDILRAWVDEKGGMHLSRSDMSRWIGIENPCSIKLKSARAFDSVSKDTVIPMAEAMDYLEKKSTKVRARTLAKGIREHSFQRSESVEESAREDVEVASMNVIRRKRKRERMAKSMGSEKSVRKSSKRGDGDGDEGRTKKRRKDKNERKRIEKRRKLARKQIEEMEELLSRTPSSSRSCSSNSDSSSEEDDEGERRHEKGRSKEEGSEEEMEIDEEEEEEEEEEQRAEKAESGSESERGALRKGAPSKAKGVGGKVKGKGREEAPPGRVKGKAVTKIDERAERKPISKAKHGTTIKDDSSKHVSITVPSKVKAKGKGKGKGKDEGKRKEKEKGDRWEPIRVIEDKRDATPSGAIPNGKKRKHSSMEAPAKEVGNGTIAPPPPSPRPIKKTRSGEITDYDKLLELRIQSLEDDIHVKNETIKTLNMVLRKIVRGKGEARGSEAGNAQESGEGTIEPDTERAGEDGYEDDAKEKVDGGFLG